MQNCLKPCSAHTGRQAGRQTGRQAGAKPPWFVRGVGTGGSLEPSSTQTFQSREVVPSTLRSDRQVFFYTYRWRKVALYYYVNNLAFKALSFKVIRRSPPSPRKILFRLLLPSPPPPLMFSTPKFSVLAIPPPNHPTADEPCKDPHPPSFLYPLPPALYYFLVSETFYSPLFSLRTYPQLPEPGLSLNRHHTKI